MLLLLLSERELVHTYFCRGINVTNVCYNTLNEQRQKCTKLTLINVIWPDVHDFSMQLSLHGLNVANKKNGIQQSLLSSWLHHKHIMDPDCVQYHNALRAGLIAFGWLELWLIESALWNSLPSYCLGFSRRTAEMVTTGKTCSVKECC